MTTHIVPHPVSRLLNDEQRARVAAAEFKRVKAHGKTPVTKVGNRWRCPMGVAVGSSGTFPTPGTLCRLLDLPIFKDGVFSPEWVAFESFILAADKGEMRPEDVKPLLGVSNEEA